MRVSAPPTCLLGQYTTPSPHFDIKLTTSEHIPRSYRILSHVGGAYSNLHCALDAAFPADVVLGDVDPPCVSP